MPDLREDPDHDAVCASGAPHQVVVAPPGTGKTYLSIRLAGEVAPQLPSPYSRVLVVTFSNQARTQLEREAVRQLTPAARQRVEITNYHRFFWQAVLAHRRALGLPMRIDIGSHARRLQALAALGRDVARRLQQYEGLVDCLAEHAHPEFRDERTPDPDELARLLEIVDREQRAGLLVFDDLGALFWRLLNQFPVLERAYQERYPVVIADEHQDASALQDAFVRRLSRARLVVLADPMQLIHGFRGASPARLQRHLDHCNEVHSLTTAHRWHDSEELAVWLLAVRTRLEGTASPVPPPAVVDLIRTNADHGQNAVKLRVRIAAAQAFANGARSVAVLARTNDEVSAYRRYLSQQGLHPRQLGGDFEDARVDIEQLPLLHDAQTVALHGLDRLAGLIPTLTRATIQQAHDRLQPDRVQLHRASREAARILGPFQRIYEEGPHRYVEALVTAMDACAAAGHDLPRAESVRALRDTAAAIAGQDGSLDDVLERYSEKVIVAAHAAPRSVRGLFVMTAHQAKGKEFDAVVLADVSARFWPGDEETRRLLYVAVTRATSRWDIIAPDRGESPLLRHVMGD